MACQGGVPAGGDFRGGEKPEKIFLPRSENTTARPLTTHREYNGFWAVGAECANAHDNQKRSMGHETGFEFGGSHEPDGAVYAGAVVEALDEIEDERLGGVEIGENFTGVDQFLL